ncbi:MAG: hypothetical protein AABY09_01825 [Nanoarchaeota archaeon]
MANFYESELKTIITWNLYKRLGPQLEEKTRLVRHEVAHSILFKPGWHALKYNEENLLEYVVREDPDCMCTEVSRQQLNNSEYLDIMGRLGKEKVMVREWDTKREVFSHARDGFIYGIYLERIFRPGVEEPAYVLKVRHKGEELALLEHALRMRRMMVSLGAPNIIHPSQFEDRIGMCLAARVR